MDDRQAEEQLHRMDMSTMDNHKVTVDEEEEKVENAKYWNTYLLILGEKIGIRSV